MLKIVNNGINLIINISKLAKDKEDRSFNKPNVDSKYSFNLVSSSNTSSFNTKSRSLEDYKRIRKEMRFSLLTEEDMLWIDENAKEDIVESY